MKHAIRSWTSLPLLALAACAGPVVVGNKIEPDGKAADRGVDPSAWGAPDELAEAAEPVDEPGVVGAPPPGSLTEGAPTHELAPTSEGRMYLIELYQDTVESLDAVTLEKESLAMELERARARIAELESAKSEGAARIAELEAERDALRGENRELGGRLTTAQIRRLESEKLLIEAKLEWEREAMAAKASSSAPANAPMVGQASER